MKIWLSTAICRLKVDVLAEISLVQMARFRIIETGNGGILVENCLLDAD